jgi:hypothetical protein
MAEYIDRKALDKAMTIAAANGKDKDRRTWAKAICVLHDMPIVDAVPVVRCKDCKYRDGTPGQPNILCAQMHEDDFCSYGERKEEPHD